MRDVNGRALLTHMGKYQARLVSLVIDGNEAAAATQDGPGSPRVIFTDPHIAAGGLTEAAARDAGIDVLVVSRSTAGTAGASLGGRGTPGTSQLIIDRTRNVIIGATFVGAEVADFLHGSSCWRPGRVRLNAILGGIRRTHYAHSGTRSRGDQR